MTFSFAENKQHRRKFTIRMVPPIKESGGSLSSQHRQQTADNASVPFPTVLPEILVWQPVLLPLYVQSVPLIPTLSSQAALSTHLLWLVIFKLLSTSLPSPSQTTVANINQPHVPTPANSVLFSRGSLTLAGGMVTYRVSLFLHPHPSPPLHLLTSYSSCVDSSNFFPNSNTA